MVNANIFSASEETSWDVSGDSLIAALKKTIRSIYMTLRNLAALVLLCLLIYTGIRIVLSSNSVNEKMKWKMMLFDWLKALCLVIFVHLIMIGIFYISDLLVQTIGDIAYGNESLIFQIRKQFNESSWFDGTQQIVLVIMYGYITYLTVVFVIAYMKRLMWTMILIVIAPIVSVTYALGHSQKQIFNRWFKEFIMNVLIQPYHLLIYWILVSIPLGLLGESGAFDYFSAIYALVAISFIRPAEKFLRKLLDFDKSEVANTASFESGKSTLDHGKDFIKSVGSTVAAIYTGGATLSLASTTGGGSTGTNPNNPDPNNPDPSNPNPNNPDPNNPDPSNPNPNNPDPNNPDPNNPDPNNPDLGRPETRWEKAARTIEEGAHPIEALKRRFGGEDQFGGRLTNVGHAIYNSKPVTAFRESGAGQLTLALGHRIGNTARYIASEEGQRKIQKLRRDAHEAVDSLYIGGAPKDWHFNINAAEAKIKQVSEEKLQNFVNNENNIKAMIEANGFKDDEYSTAKEKAKKKLEKAAPYLDRGITNVHTINALIDFQKEHGLSVDAAIQGYMRKETVAQNTNNFILNTENNTYLEQISQSVTGQSWDANNDTIRREVADAIAPYMDRGISSPELMARLIGTEMSLRGHGMNLPKGKEGAIEVTKIEKLLEKAVKENFDGISKKIEFSNVREKDKTPALKKQEEALNKTLQDKLSGTI